MRRRGAAAILFVLGCASRGAGPSATAAAFGAAVERGDAAAAYALTSADYRARVPLATFAAELQDGGAAMRDAGRALREGRSPPRAEVDLGHGEALGLVEEGGAWRVDGPLEPWSQRTPRAALRTFVRALEAKRYDVVLRLVPARARPGVTVESLRLYWEGPSAADNAQLVSRLRAALGSPIVEEGAAARMPYGERDEARLVREDGLWKIEDPD
ncbi:MAG TPA: hypothetical protein VHJ20_17675 [Polyangia bacterium]|nr:hypothetical protein [Polyangia bacterium]